MVTVPTWTVHDPVLGSHSDDGDRRCRLLLARGSVSGLVIFVGHLRGLPTALDRSSSRLGVQGLGRPVLRRGLKFASRANPAAYSVPVVTPSADPYEGFRRDDGVARRPSKQPTRGVLMGADGGGKSLHRRGTWRPSNGDEEQAPGG